MWTPLEFSFNLWGWVDSKFEFGLLSVVDGQTFHEETGETGTSSAAKGMEDEESLQPGAVVGQFANAVENVVDYLLADRVVPTRVVVGRILFTSDQLFRVVKLTVSALTNLKDKFKNQEFVLTSILTN